MLTSGELLMHIKRSGAVFLFLPLFAGLTVSISASDYYSNVSSSSKLNAKVFLRRRHEEFVVYSALTLALTTRLANNVLGLFMLTYGLTPLSTSQVRNVFVLSRNYFTVVFRNS
jgi:ABC-type spermidine/putrescine transport system permease subunit II